MLKVYGYALDDPDRIREFELVSLCFDEDGLEDFAAFAMRCAGEMRDEPDWDHQHFRGDRPDIVIARLRDKSA